jgi:hypothetical protein
MLVDVRKVDVHPPIKIPLSVCLCGKLKIEGTVMLKLNPDNFLEPSKQQFFYPWQILQVTGQDPSWLNF